MTRDGCTKTPVPSRHASRHNRLYRLTSTSVMISFSDQRYSVNSSSLSPPYMPRTSRLVKNTQRKGLPMMLSDILPLVLTSESLVQERSSINLFGYKCHSGKRQNHAVSRRTSLHLPVCHGFSCEGRIMTCMVLASLT